MYGMNPICENMAKTKSLGDAYLILKNTPFFSFAMIMHVGDILDPKERQEKF